VLAGPVLAGCGSSPSAAAPSSSAASGEPAVSGQITVLAAASLTEGFTGIGKAFEAAHPGTTVKFSFAASSALAQQIISGAPADVFASASPTTMKQVIDPGLAAGAATTFVRNHLEIAVPKGNPKHIAGLADLTTPDLKLALCAAQVPCGGAAATAFKTANLTPKPVTLEQDVKATLTKLELGEVDAAVVYRTDVNTASDKVDGVEFPESGSAINDYPIATLAKAPNAAGAKAFVSYVLSDPGLAVLTKEGFDKA
jgi:molybdate transport system substrate-binding protein